MQLRNRHFLKDPMNIHGGLEADATAEQMFLKRPPQIFLGIWSSKSGRNCATGLFQRNNQEVGLDVEADATAEQTFSKRPL
jgi:hypothetical protein